MTKLTLTPVPPSVNHLYKMTCRGNFASMYKTQEAKDIQETYGWLIKQQTRDFYLGPISLDITVYFGDNRRHDIDNVNKILFDSLTGVIIEDDSQVLDLTIRKRLDKENPRVEMIIRDIKS